MSKRGKTVEVDLDLYESITRIVEESAGFKPKIKDFVDKAIREKLDRYHHTSKADDGELPGLLATDSPPGN